MRVLGTAGTGKSADDDDDDEPPVVTKAPQLTAKTRSSLKIEQVSPQQVRPQRRQGAQQVTTTRQPVSAPKTRVRVNY